MRIAFINPDLANEYDVATPFDKPLGGSESAQCYLAIELARRKHNVFVLNGRKNSSVVKGVYCRPLENAFDEIGVPDIIFVTNAPYFIKNLRRAVGNKIPIYLWEHNIWNPDPDYCSPLQNPICENDYIVCVSDWHKKHFVENGKLNPDRIVVLKNAMAPCFENCIKGNKNILDNKAWPPIMAFTSTPYKGLEAVILFFQELRKNDGSVTLNVFSGFDIYSPNNDNHANPHWQHLYQLCRQTNGINYIGNVEQSYLVRTLKSTLVLFYPNVLQETSSICAMEAMASGCAIVTTSYGALPETLAGFGKLVDFSNEGQLSGDDFIKHAMQILEQFKYNDKKLENTLRQQASFANKNYRWSIRAKEIETIIKQRL